MTRTVAAPLRPRFDAVSAGTRNSVLGQAGPAQRVGHRAVRDRGGLGVTALPTTALSAALPGLSAALPGLPVALSLPSALSLTAARPLLTALLALLVEPAG